jgi:hypothetical protein
VSVLLLVLRQVAEFMKLICKVFWSATFMSVPELLLQTEQFSGWMMALHQAMRRELPWVSRTDLPYPAAAYCSTCLLFMTAAADSSSNPCMLMQDMCATNQLAKGDSSMTGLVLTMNAWHSHSLAGGDFGECPRGDGLSGIW